MAKSTLPPTAEEVRQRFNYDPKTGILTNRMNLSSNARIGKEAGCIGPYGYRQVHVAGRLYQGHRIIWLMVYGVWPTLTIDHRDRNRLNNRLENLREADRTLQCINTPRPSDNTSGAKGVYLDKRRGTWYSRISVDRKLVHLGWFKNKQDAIAARHSAMIARFGEDYAE